MPDTAERQASFYLGKQYDPVEMRYNLGRALLLKVRPREAAAHLSAAVRLDPDHAGSHYLLALALAGLREADQARTHYAKAVALELGVDTSPTLHYLMAANSARAGKLDEAIASSQKALGLAQAAGKSEFAREIKRMLESYRRQKARRP